MGLTLILQLAAKWRHTEFLQYPSAVLNSMQGKRAGSSYMGYPSVTAKLRIPVSSQSQKDPVLVQTLRVARIFLLSPFFSFSYLFKF